MPLSSIARRGQQACFAMGVSPTCLVAFASAVCAVAVMLSNRTFFRPTLNDSAYPVAHLAVQTSGRANGRLHGAPAPIFYSCIDCEINRAPVAVIADDDEPTFNTAYDDAAIVTKPAFLIKTFNRPACALLTLRSILLLHPDATVIIADDSDSVHQLDGAARDELSALTMLHSHASIEVLHLPYDVGVSAGRNALVERAHERGIAAVVMLDDDYALTHSFDLRRMLHVMTMHGADIVGANRCESMPFDGTTCRHDAALVVHNATLFAVPAVIPAVQGSVLEDMCSRTHFVQNAFLARTSVLRRIGWDPVLKNNDHYAFMYRASRVHNASMWLCRNMHVLHTKYGCQLNSTSRNYTAVRQSRWSALFPVVATQLGVSALVDEEGKVFRLTGETYRTTPKHACIAMRNWTANAVKRDMLSIALHVVNSHLVGGDQRSKPHAWHGCIQPAHPHVYRVRGYMKAQLANWWPANKAAPDVAFDVDVYWPTCDSIAPHATPEHHHPGCYPPEQLMQLEQSLPVDVTSPVYFITAVKDCIAYIRRLVQSLHAVARNGGTVHLVIVDFGSTDGDVAALATLTSAPRRGTLAVSVVQAPYAFSRSVGIHMGVERVRLLAKEPLTARVFVVDTSIILPADVVDRIALFVHCNNSAWVPIVTKVQGFESDAEALAWVPINGTRAQRPGALLEHAPVLSGTGMIGFCVSDYLRVQGYDLGHGFRWGGEDKELVNSLSRAGLRMIRLLADGMWHAQYKKASLMAYRADTNGQSPADVQRLLPVTAAVGALHPWRALVQRWMPDALRHLPDPRISAVYYVFPLSAKEQVSYGVFMIVTVDSHERRAVHVVRSGLNPRLRSLRIASAQVDVSPEVRNASAVAKK